MKILFQGDSITDAGRNYEDIHDLGRGYAKLAAELIINRHPESEFEFVNRATGGFRTENLRSRWQLDCIDHQPDIVSVLVGINDTWHRAAEKNWISNEYFEECYRHCLAETKEKTRAKIIILEQFLLPVEDKGFFREDLDPKIQITRKLAREFADVFIPLDGIFAAHCVGVAPTLWAADGVHPTEAGARLIADYYAEAFDKIFCSYESTHKR